MTEFRADLLNGIALAYSGDAVYEVFVRDYLLSQGITKPGELQRTAVKYVSAKAQAFLISEMEKDAILTEEDGQKHGCCHLPNLDWLRGNFWF